MVFLMYPKWGLPVWIFSQLVIHVSALHLVPLLRLMVPSPVPPSFVYLHFSSRDCETQGDVGWKLQDPP
jgi:hypothetical protein